MTGASSPSTRERDRSEDAAAAASRYDSACSRARTIPGTVTRQSLRGGTDTAGDVSYSGCMSSPSAPGGPSFTAPHAAPPVGTLLTPIDAPTSRRPLGALALVLSVIAGLVAPAVAGFAAFRVARGAGSEFVARGGQSVDWRLLSPVRDLVLVAEIAFWAGAALGVAAFVLGIVAVSTDRGRGAGIAAIVVSVLAPIVFALLVGVALAAGVGTSAGSAGVPV